MNTFHILIAVLIILLAYVIYLKLTEYPHIEEDKSVLNVKISDQKYDLEVANTTESRHRGLMNRTELKPKSGMLFIFENEGIYPFWMKNTLIALDIIWLNKDKEIVYIKENAQPCSNLIEAVCTSILPKKSALYVIELNAGEVQKLNLKEGDTIELNLN